MGKRKPEPLYYCMPRQELKKIIEVEKQYKNLSVEEPEDILMEGLDYKDYSDIEEEQLFLKTLITY